MTEYFLGKGSDNEHLRLRKIKGKIEDYNECIFRARGKAALSCAPVGNRLSKYHLDEKRRQVNDSTLLGDSS